MNLYRASLLLALSLGCVTTTSAERLVTAEEWSKALRDSSIQSLDTLYEESKNWGTTRSIGTRSIGTRKIICDAKVSNSIQIRFAPGSSRIVSLKDADRQLKEVATAMMDGAYANTTIVVVGHTDADGDSLKNETLSKNRAAAVRKRLVKKHKVTGRNLAIKGYGASCPIADNESPTGKARNRRVEFAVLSGNK